MISQDPHHIREGMLDYLEAFGFTREWAERFLYSPAANAESADLERMWSLPSA